MYDYFYGAEADQFSFYRIPKVLFTEERFQSISAEAKVLYGLLLDRMSLSARNGWLDAEGHRGKDECCIWTTGESTKWPRFLS